MPRAAFAIGLLLALTAPVSFVAQENVNGKYKVGDRVECDHTSGGGPFKPGTVVEVNGAGSALTCCRYRVRFDNDDPLWKEGRLCSDRFIRPSGGGARPTAGATTTAPAAPSRAADKPAAPANFDALADRKILDCPIVQKPSRPNAQPDAEVLKLVIRCLFERHAPAGMTGATTMDITAFHIGTARKWVPRSDIGSGNLDTMVHPARVSWTMKKFYESYTRVEDNISIFNCYVNAVGDWECGLGQRIKDGEARQLPRR